jgi:protein tyrosine/serine phosphatase
MIVAMSHRKLICCLLAGLMISPAAYLGGLQLTGNFHTVVAHEVYRAAQPDADDLAGYVRDYGIRSVVNLRGSHPGEAWYDEEVRSSQTLDLTHVDLALSAKRELTDTNIMALQRILQTTPRPLLLHCKSGADRTGLAAAFYLLDVQHMPPPQAAGQLSWRYGHLPCLGNRTVAMDRTFTHIVALSPSPAQ